MYKLTPAAKDDLTGIVNTILYSRMQMDDFARRGQWKKYHKARGDFNQALVDLNNKFNVETIIHKAIKEEIKQNVSTN